MEISVVQATFLRTVVKMRSYRRRLLYVGLLLVTGLLAAKYRDEVNHITRTANQLTAVQIFNTTLNHTIYVPPNTGKNVAYTSKTETEHGCNSDQKDDMINESVAFNLDCLSTKPRTLARPINDRSIHLNARTFFPPLSLVDEIIMKTLKKLPRKSQHHFCESLSQLASDKKFTYWRLPTVERWEVALRLFWSVGLEQRLPDVLGIGVKKSGTNAVVHFLKQHPLIKVPHKATEIHFFDKHYSSGIQFYKANMPLVNESQLCFEKTPRYFVTKTAPKNIAKDVLPTPKFLLCVRDPVKRALSDWHHETVIKITKRRGRSSGVRTAESEGKRFAQEVIRNDGTVNTGSDFIRTSTYDIHFERWLMYHSREQFLVLKEEDISSDPYKEMKRIEQFLGIGSFFKKEMFAYNNRKQVMCFVHENQREDCPPRYGVNIPHPTPTKEVTQKMRDFFRPHNKRFEDMLGMKFQWSDL